MNMNIETLRTICRVLILSMLLLPFSSAQAAMMGTTQAIATAPGAQAERAAVLSVLSRSEVSGQLQSLGLDPKTAADRVAAMSDQEVRSLAGKLDTLPAGAHSSGWAWAAVILIAIWIYYAWK